MDIRVAAAREHQRLSREAGSLAARHIQQRNHLVRALRNEDPEGWTYLKLAKAVGLSEELVAKIIQRRT
jgi:AraC-like DNA-binding protein